MKEDDDIATQTDMTQFLLVQWYVLITTNPFIEMTDFVFTTACLHTI